MKQRLTKLLSNASHSAIDPSSNIGLVRRSSGCVAQFNSQFSTAGNYCLLSWGDGDDNAEQWCHNLSRAVELGVETGKPFSIWANCPEWEPVLVVHYL